MVIWGLGEATNGGAIKALDLKMKDSNVTAARLFHAYLLLGTLLPSQLTLAQVRDTRASNLGGALWARDLKLGLGFSVFFGTHACGACPFSSAGYIALQESGGSCAQDPEQHCWKWWWFLCEEAEP